MDTCVCSQKDKTSGGRGELILLQEDREIFEELSPEETQCVILALFDDAPDITSFTKAAKIAYLTMSRRETRISGIQKARGLNGGAPKGNKNAAKNNQNNQNNQNNPYQTDTEPKPIPNQTVTESQKTETPNGVLSGKPDAPPAEQGKASAPKASASQSEAVSVCKAAVEHLNAMTGARYQHTNVKTRQHINARLEEGYTLADFVAVIDAKCAEWCGTNMAQYLRPETLFCPKNFAGYVIGARPSPAVARAAPSMTDEEYERTVLAPKREKWRKEEAARLARGRPPDSNREETGLTDNANTNTGEDDGDG